MQRPKIPHYYGRLKVAPDAPPEVIRAAYKALAQKYHPDRHRGSVRHELVLTALNKAQEVLLDPERRAAHDQWIRSEEERIGYREPVIRDAPGLPLRLKLLWSGVRQGGLSFGDAWLAYLTGAQRLVFGTVGVVALAALLGGTVVLLLPRNDVLKGLTPPPALPKALSAADDPASGPH
ncbi:J domain-containing protein [Methylibium sp.]|uniref:J domain-containing protein n=1 Tax=Methylibium sp. TaxID=2067992 RepID=UPI003D0A83A9